MADEKSPSAPHITQLRAHLMDTLADLRDREKPMEADRARAVAQVAAVLIDSAKVEIDYLRATQQTRSDFLETPPDPTVAHLGRTSSPTGTTERLPGVTRHRIGG